MDHAVGDIGCDSIAAVSDGGNVVKGGVTT
jgi:hypothetical protein